MLHSITSARRLVCLALLVPCAAIAAGCSDDGSSDTNTDPTSDTGVAGGDTNSSGDTLGASDVATDADAQPPAPDTTAPEVESNVPASGAMGVSTAAKLRVTFDERMASATLTGTSFVVKRGDTAVSGAVTYSGRTATFAPTEELALGTTYTATLTTAATDVAGNALAAAHTWSFTTDSIARLGPSPVFLGAAGDFVILAKSAISNVPTSKITGDLGLSPAAATYITGFDLTKAGTRWTSPQVTGSLFAADNDPPTPTELTTAVGNMQTAYTDAAGRPTPTALNLGAGTIGGLTFAPGLYKWTSTVTIPTDITLSGRANDVWIFQVSGDLKLAAAKSMNLTGGARPKNIFWQVAGGVELGTTSHAEGIVLTQTAIKLATGASINGRLLAQTAVTLAGNTVVEPAL